MELAEDAVLEMNTIQLGGVDHSVRTTTGSLGDRAKLLIHESLMTDGDEYVMTDFDVDRVLSFKICSPATLPIAASWISSASR